MQGRVGIDGSSVVMLFADGRTPRTRPLTPRHFGPAHDTGPQDPAKTFTLRTTLEHHPQALTDTVALLLDHLLRP